MQHLPNASSTAASFGEPLSPHPTAAVSAWGWAKAAGGGGKGGRIQRWRAVFPSLMEDECGLGLFLVFDPLLGGEGCAERCPCRPPPPCVVFQRLALRPLCWLCFGCPMLVRGPTARCGVSLCHVAAPFQPLACSLHLSGLTSAPPSLRW